MSGRKKSELKSINGTEQKIVAENCVRVFVQ